MTIKYAYRIENGQVIDGIVVDGVNTNAQWAIENIGGLWVDADAPAWIGGTWNETNGFQPVEPEPEE